MLVVPFIFGTTSTVFAGASPEPGPFQCPVPIPGAPVFTGELTLVSHGDAWPSDTQDYRYFVRAFVGEVVDDTGEKDKLTGEVKKMIKPVTMAEPEDYYKEILFENMTVDDLLIDPETGKPRFAGYLPTSLLENWDTTTYGDKLNMYIFAAKKFELVVMKDNEDNTIELAVQATVTLIPYREGCCDDEITCCGFSGCCIPSCSP
jgi:hypothetical protein